MNTNKSLENQKETLGKFLKNKSVSPQLNGMLRTLIDYYAQYQNEYVKHNDNVNEDEIEFIFDITSALMKHLVKLSRHK